MYPRDFSKQLRTRLAEGVALDGAMRDLRSSGASIIECIAAIKRVRGCDLAEAKAVVHHSEAWADVTKPTEAMWAELAQAFDENAEPDAPPNGGPAASVNNSNAPGGPPSVS